MNTDDGSTKAWIASVSLLWIVLYQAVHVLCAAQPIVGEPNPQAA